MIILAFVGTKFLALVPCDARFVLTVGVWLGVGILCCLPSYLKHRQPLFLLPWVRIVCWAMQYWHPFQYALPPREVVAIGTWNLGEGLKFLVYNTLGRWKLGIFYGGSNCCIALSDSIHSPTPGTVGYHTSPQPSPFLFINKGSNHLDSESRQSHQSVAPEVNSSACCGTIQSTDASYPLQLLLVPLFPSTASMFGTCPIGLGGGPW